MVIVCSWYKLCRDIWRSGSFLIWSAINHPVRSPTVAQTGYLRLKNQPWNWTSTQPEMKWSSHVFLFCWLYDWLDAHVPLTHSCPMSCDWFEAHNRNMLLTYVSDCFCRVALFWCSWLILACVKCSMNLTCELKLSTFWGWPKSSLNVEHLG